MTEADKNYMALALELAERGAGWTSPNPMVGAVIVKDGAIIGRVAELAEQHGVTMTEISLAWLLQKVTAPVVGATKLHHIEGAAKAVELELSPQEMAYLEEPYVPHKLVGVMAQNTPAAAGAKQVWTVK